MAYRIVAERRDETVRMDRSSMLMAVAKARLGMRGGCHHHRHDPEQDIVCRFRQSPVAGLRDSSTPGDRPSLP
jgi:hypothetical protein